MMSLPRTLLSVNLNKVALVRNSRSLGIPSLVVAAQHCLGAGAHGITVHPRPDERHIRTSDVFALAELLQDYPKAEFNIEGNPLHNLMPLVRRVRPQQCTFVPDSHKQATSDHGWCFPKDLPTLAPLVQEALNMGVRVSLFMDADASAMAAAKTTGTKRIELYTEPWYSAFANHRATSVLRQFTAAAQAANASGLEINAGHDLNLDNLGPLLRAIPSICEVSIGHALVSDALERGYAQAVRAYLTVIENAKPTADILQP